MLQKIKQKEVGKNYLILSEELLSPLPSDNGEMNPCGALKAIIIVTLPDIFFLLFFLLQQSHISCPKLSYLSKHKLMNNSKTGKLNKTILYKDAGVDIRSWSSNCVQKLCLQQKALINDFYLLGVGKKELYVVHKPAEVKTSKYYFS